MSLLDIPFDGGDIANDEIRALVNGVAEDVSLAAAIYAKGRRTYEVNADAWVPRLTLLAAHRLGKAPEFLPDYEKFLAWMDTQSRKDWHSRISDNAPSNDMYSQSGDLGLPAARFPTEFQRLLDNLGPPEEGHILDVGCGGGLWAINLARAGYTVVGTDRHPGIIEHARWNAQNLEVEDKVKFFVDDACNSTLPPEYHSARILCMGVTATLPDDAAFYKLLEFLDKTSRTNRSPTGRKRMVTLTSNRWGLQRMRSVNDVLEKAAGDYPLAAYRLAMIELNWWMHPQHVVATKKLFPEITLIGERVQNIDGTREDFLLQ